MYEKGNIDSRYYCIAIIIVLVFSFLLGRASVCNNGERVDNVGEQITSSEKQQRVITEQINDAKQQVSDIRSIVADTGNAISDAEQILQGIRARGKKEIK